MILFPEALRRFPVFSVLPLREASGWDEAKAFIPVALNPLLAFVEKNTHTHKKKNKNKKMNKQKSQLSRVGRLTGEL